MLDMSEMINRLIFHEGIKLKPYICPAGKLTIGIGRNTQGNPFTKEELARIGNWKNGITREQAYWLCQNDIERCIKELRNNLIWFDKLDAERKYALIDLCFNCGIRTLLGFKKMLGNISVGNYNKASDELLNSKYAKKDSPKRAKRISNLIKTGRWVI